MDNWECYCFGYGLGFVPDAANRNVKNLLRLFRTVVNTVVLAQHIYAFLDESRT